MVLGSGELSSTGDITKVSGPPIDHFCSGHSVGGNGGLVVAGGTEFYGNDDDTWVHDPYNHKAVGHFTGRSEVWFYDAFTPAWNLNATLMNQGRWYPSLIGVNDYYDMIALSGHPGNKDKPHLNTDISFSYNGWGGSIGKYIDHSGGYYPRGHLLSDRTVFMSGRGGENGNNMRLRVQWWDSKFEQWEAGKAADDEIYARSDSTSVLMPYRWVRRLFPLPWQSKYRYTSPEVMLVNGVQPMIKNLGSGSNLEWQPTTKRNADPNGRVPKRTFGYATLLPTDDIFANGGVAVKNQDDPLWSEVYRVDKGEWNVAARPNKARNYHSVSLLMPDGRVWTAGSNKQAKQSFEGCIYKDASACKDYRELQIEIFEPWYYNHPVRPAIIFAPNNIGQGDTFSVKTSAGQNVVRAAVVRPGSATHAFDFDQRYVELQVVKHHDGWVDLKMPGNGFMTPAGYYMLFVSVNAGHPAGLIPSKGVIVHVREPA